MSQAPPDAANFQHPGFLMAQIGLVQPHHLLPPVQADRNSPEVETTEADAAPEHPPTPEQKSFLELLNPLSDNSVMFSKQLFSNNQKEVSRGRLQSDLNDLEQTPMEGVIAGTFLENMWRWNAVIEGPKNSPYAGGIFFVDFEFPETYPYDPPEITWRTRIYHLNISKLGDVYCKEINREWKSSMTVRNILEHLVNLLQVPRPDHLNEGDHYLRKVYEKNPKVYEKTAREWTMKYGR
ncbi:hypothetical protein L596_009433 [Steinernema carpocapsae]|uniref:UBC core domain-containing protein n=1 Tax=Steinernema carpocapsae TaxID=34508 RepID=A0A4U5PFU0_STECR|nr:hypothetical protein L596_009433 [Steinernema carpocapsae]